MDSQNRKSDTASSQTNFNSENHSFNNPEKVIEKQSNGELGLHKYKMQDFVPFNMPMHRFNALFVIYPAHIFGLYGFYLSFTGQTTNAWMCFLFFIVYGYGGGLGVTAGCHRYWTHRSYKAKMPLQIMMMLMQTSVIQYPIIKWCRDHRIHHKYTDTNADPHSAHRGFWFSHMGWVLEPEHPEVLIKEKKISMDDLECDPVLQFQAKWYWELVILTVFIIPMTFIYFVFPQPFLNIVCINYSRWLLTTHLSGCINSVAHYFGDKPYDKNVSSVDNKILAFFTVGEAWHNYHHAFPYDYKTSELPIWGFNWTTAFIDFFAWVGWAYDLKTVPIEMVEKRANRTGDGTRQSHHHHHHETNTDASKTDENGNSDEILPTKIDGKVASWGWGDVDMANEAKVISTLLNRTRER